MTHILVQNHNCKFINNIDSISDKYFITLTNINKNIYKIDQKINPDIYILISDYIDYEEIHFCNSTDKKIIIYEFNKPKSEQIKEKENIIVLNNKQTEIIYNEKRFHNSNSDREIEFCYFLDNDNTIPAKISQQLYPSSKKKFKLFNNKLIDNPQNLGLLNETDKARVLNSTQVFVTKNMFYAVEAFLCGCDVVDTDMQKISVNLNNYKTYEQYFENLI